MHALVNSIPSILAAVGETDMAYNSGRVVGQVFFFILILAGILKCWSISRRPTTNTRCALGLMFVLCGLIASGATGLLRSSSLDYQIRTPLTLVFSLCLFGCLAAGIILAIIGLVEISQKPTEYTQGKNQAIWTLVLGGIFGLIFIGGFVSAFVTGRETGSTNLLTRGVPGQVITNQELNFRFATPPRPWTVYAGAKLNKDCKLSFMRMRPEVYFMIIGESLGGSAEFSTEQLADIGKAHLESAAQTSKVLKEKPFSKNGLNGLLVETDAQVRNLPLYYQHWYIATNGFAYQLIGYGRQADRLKVAEEMSHIFGYFELLDYTRVSGGGGKKFTTNFSSSNYGYSVDVLDSIWHEYPNLEKEFSKAEFGASRGDSCLVVVPISLEGQKPGLNALTAGFLALMSINYPDEELKNQQEYHPSGFAGVRYDYEREIEKLLFRYRFGIVQSEDRAWFVAAWTQRHQPDAEQILTDAFSRVKFTRTTSPFLSSPDGAPQFTSKQRKTHAYVLNQAGLFHYHAAEYDQALPLFRTAVDLVPTERLYLENAFLTWSHIGKPREALEFLQKQPAASMEVPEVRAWQAFFQGRASLINDAVTNYGTVFAAGFRDDNHFAEYINLLNENQRYADSLLAITNYLKQEDSVRVRVLEAETYTLKGDSDLAIKLLKQQREKAPFNVQISGQLVEAYLKGGTPNEALTLSVDLIKQNANSAYPLFLKGKSELALKWYREAKGSFQDALKLAPTDKTLQSYLDHVSGLLGQGNNRLVRESIEPVTFPSEWTNCTVEPVPDFEAKQGAYYLRRIEAIQWEPGKDHRTTEYIDVRLLDASGVAAFSTLQRSFDPLSEEVYVNDVRVLDASGKVQSVGNVDDYYVLDDKQDEMATQAKVLNVPVAGLQPGCRLQVTMTRRELGKTDEFPFFEHCFSRGYPIQQSLVFLRGNGSRLKYRTTPETQPDKTADGLSWRSANPVIIRYEPLQVPISRYAPMLWIADASAQWPALVSNYLASISDRCQPDSSLSNIVADLVQDAKNPASKIAALAAYVQTNVTYKAIEFGRRARIPNRPSEVFRNKYGDCKDHSVLLRQMLLAAGIPAQLVLLNTHVPVEKDLPSLDQFNHMIVFVPGQRELFIDATDKGCDPVCGSPSPLAGCDALILDQVNPRFSSIPIPAEKDCVVELDRQLRLIDSENVVAEDKMLLSGMLAAYLRNYLHALPSASRQVYFQHYMGLSEVDLSEFKVDPLEMPGAPLQVLCRYTIRKEFHRLGNGLSGSIRAFLERGYLAADPIDNRLSPFEIRTPILLKSTVRLEIPAGYRAETPAELAPRMDARFGSCTQACFPEGNQLVTRFECRKAVGNFNAKDYAAFRESMAQALTGLERNISLTEKGAGQQN